MTASLRAILTTTGLVKWFHNFTPYLVLIGIFRVSLTRAIWWRDITREATLQGPHTIKVTSGLRIGIVLFIISEVIFFFSFF
ncbi:hypothetical protein GUF45_13335 [Xanthomonas citri pv. citri]|nr:hypothetical protein [Xanthomonas citri pv. citri]